ncbi:MAG: DNA-processing protein DprA [Campylobacterota bacterium]|nr:DNA-processing protein DprA [Campylobacterota bacterium]
MIHTTIQTIDFHIKELDAMKKYPKELSYIGDIALLNKRKISIVGSRNPNQYTQQYTHLIASELSKKGICIVSGAAMGVDAIAHSASTPSNTIAVAGTGLDIRYPTINQALIKDIESNGLVLSQFKNNQGATRYTFPLRNELVVALSEALVVTQADLKSGTMRSVEYALKMEKPIYVLPQRVNDSEGTNELLKNGLANCIYNLENFVDDIVGYKNDIKHTDQFLEYCKSNPTYDEAMAKYPQEVFEYELMAKINVENGLIFVK